MRLNVIDFSGLVQGSTFDRWVDMPAGSVGAAVRIGDWAVDAAGVAGPRPIEVMLQHPATFATDGQMVLDLTYAIGHPA